MSHQLRLIQVQWGWGLFFHELLTRGFWLWFGDGLRLLCLCYAFLDFRRWWRRFLFQIEVLDFLFIGFWLWRTLSFLWFNLCLGLLLLYFNPLWRRFGFFDLFRLKLWCFKLFSWWLWCLIWGTIHRKFRRWLLNLWLWILQFLKLNYIAAFFRNWLRRNFLSFLLTRLTRCSAL